MEKNLSLQEMEDLLAAHEEAEFVVDIDATMATLVKNPVYELPTLGWLIEGWDAVYETYRRMLPAGEVRNIWAERRVHAIADNTLCREAYVYFDTDEGRKTGRYYVVMEFDPTERLIKSERMYMDTAFAKAMAASLGPDFGDIPGVSNLEENSPPPLPRLDRAAEHAANPYH